MMKSSVATESHIFARRGQITVLLKSENDSASCLTLKIRFSDSHLSSTYSIGHVLQSYRSGSHVKLNFKARA